ncbi:MULTISPECIES: hypothetical protein [Caldilinea]|uniref:Uncharacterized protein n=1 Tax=Caldilinea aerophila (strain DSM 14535 / JCM 11387 / NBRC 104270 / STL-6-O1) TaxID=926550 RepID=I0I7Y7_CALAS|nr:MULTISPECIES: hypothetical protein [Caldilinea]BAM01375.1 hypothetical protein CLDAP_33350 [Caldilinea aerophila DSM 14535 = NBRC 104270]GIV72715.1 MAG: hypothetical protein KatS3mg049_1271 [Caldilinea sp.]
MDTTLLSPLITGLLGIVSGIVGTYLTAILKFRKDLEAEYDKDLRSRRLDVYKTLWNHLQLVARYDLPKPLTPSTLEELTIAMRTWYFNEGGIYLSEPTRARYFELKEAIKLVLETQNASSNQELNEHDRQRVLNLASLLRASMTSDVGTRKSSPLADS